MQSREEEVGDDDDDGNRNGDGSAQVDRLQLLTHFCRTRACCWCSLGSDPVEYAIPEVTRGLTQTP